MTETYDVAIIGAGTAGLAALHEVQKRTERVVIINRGPYGTTCARVGCMPSKALIESANAFHRREDFGDFGIQGAASLALDIPAVLRRVRRLRDEFVEGIVSLTAALGERSIAGDARFIDANTLEVAGRTLRARVIIIATGSRPVVPVRWRELGQRVLTSDEIFEQATLPATMGVIGLGSVGAELAQAFARLGIAVTAVGSDTSIAGLTDPEINTVAMKLLSQELTLITNQRADLQPNGDRVRVIAGSATIHVDGVLAALGREPNVQGLGLERLGVARDENGVPHFDAHTMQVGQLPVFIAGDSSSMLPVLHVANDMGYISGFNALRESPQRFRMRTPLSIVFTDPNIAIVGKRFSELDAQDIAIGRVDFSRQGRSRMARENRGQLNVYARKVDGRLLGAEMCAPRGEHLAHLLAFALEQRATVQDLLRMPFYHPVFEEGLRTALREVAKQVHLTPQSDLARCEPVGAAALD